MQSVLFSLAIISASVAGVTASPTTSARSLSIRSFKDTFSQGGVAPRTDDGQDVWYIPESCTPQCKVFFDFVDKCECADKNPTLDDILKCECNEEFNAGLASCITCYIDTICNGDCEDGKKGGDGKKDGKDEHWQGRRHDDGKTWEGGKDKHTDNGGKDDPQCVKELTCIGQEILDQFSKDCCNAGYPIKTLTLGTWDGHKDDGHKDDGHKDDGHKDDGHK